MLMDRTLTDPGPLWLTISGGNPGLHDLGHVVQAWQSLAHESGWLRRVAVETQGSRWQPWFAEVDLLTISPKPPSSGMKNATLERFMEHVGEAEEYNGHYHPSDIHGTNKWAIALKVVVFDEDDYQFARALHNEWPLIPFYLSCGTAMGGLSGSWVPPEPWLPDDDQDQVHRIRDGAWSPVESRISLLRRYRWLAERMMGDEVMADVAGFPQLHALTWGIETRGV